MKAVIRAATPDAETRVVNGTWEPARPGRTLLEGDQARTFENGEMRVQLVPHGGAFTMRGGSTVEIERFGATSEDPNVVAVLRLTSGRIVGDTLKLPKGKKVVIKTNGGTFSIP